MFEVNNRIWTPKGPGIIVSLKKSTYSNTILFYIVNLDSGENGYLCPIDSAKEI